MNQAASPSAGTNCATTKSTDGTTIAYERLGSGPLLILVGGALNDRQSPIAGVPLAELLAGNFTVYAYDRRGRGNSGDTLPYTVDREIEDLAALIAEVGEPVFLWGHSSGAGLVVEAAMAGLPISKLAIYEPPYSIDMEAEAGGKKFAAKLAALLAEGRNEEALVFWMTETGIPPDVLEGMRQSPFWLAARKMAPTLIYDVNIMRHGGDSIVPRERIAGISTPILTMAGSESPDWMRYVPRSLAEAAPNGRYVELGGHSHLVPAEAVAPELRKFFLGD
jgi:pimeloyl-ACP methyl ester carboxylesterase